MSDGLMCQKTIHDEGHDLHISMWVFSESWRARVASLCPVHSSYIKYKRRCKLQLLCTNSIFYIWSTSFVVVCIWVCLWKHVTDLTRIKMNTKHIAHHGSSFTLHQVIVHHPQNTKGARPFTVLCKVEMKSRLQPVLVGPSLAQTCWKLKWFDIQKLWIFWLPIFGICQKHQTDEAIFTCDLVSEGFWALPNHRGSGSLTWDWIDHWWPAMVTSRWLPGDFPGKLRCD